MFLAHLHSSPLVARQRDLLKWDNSFPDSYPISSSNPESALGGSIGVEPLEIVAVETERILLEKCLQESNKQIIWHSEVATLHNFRKVLSLGAQILHFSGHGIPGQIVFENARCEAHFISKTELKELILAGGDISNEGQGSPSHQKDSSLKLKLVIISACYSESVAEAFVSAGVPHVIVVSKDEKILDKKAVEFSRAFYCALLGQHSIIEAFNIGQVQADIAINGDHGKAKFKLMGNGNHSEQIVQNLQTGIMTRSVPPLPINDCDAVTEAFVGRSIEVYMVYKALVDGARLVTVIGEKGIGKTEIALQCARYATERRVFKRIFFCCCSSDDTSARGKNLIARLAKCFDVSAGNADDLASEVRKKCFEDSYLLILDGCDQFISKSNALRSLLLLLTRRSPTLSVLATVGSRIGAIDGVGEKVVSVKQLQMEESALLFMLRAPREIRTHEMEGKYNIESFAKNPIIRSLNGHPRMICTVAQYLMDKNMSLDREEFLQHIIPSVNVKILSGSIISNRTEVNQPVGLLTPAARVPGDHTQTNIVLNDIDDFNGQTIWNLAVHRAASGVDSTGTLLPVSDVSVRVLFPLLVEYFQLKLGAEAARRPLSHRSVEFLRLSNSIWGGESPAKCNNMVNQKMYTCFWQWFRDLLVTVRFSRLWSFTKPRLLHGFLSKAATTSMLQNMAIGTFLIRFSETKLSTFVIAYVNREGSVSFVRIVFRNGQWYVQTGSSYETSFQSIQELVVSIRVLQYLFPNVPKETVFK